MCESDVIANTQAPAIGSPKHHLLAFKPLEHLSIDFLKLDRSKGVFEDILAITYS